MKKLSVLLLFLLGMLSAEAQKNTYNVAIFINSGMEILDFAGPAEVFSYAGFNTYTVASSSEPIISQGFVKITPQYTIEDFPKPDIVVVLGGGTNGILKDEKALTWFRNVANEADLMFSVCTGARVFAEVGLLDGKKATTFYGALDQLEKTTPKAEILRNTRFVDNGTLITTAGVSAGIDGALHVVSKLMGQAAAIETARYMEYDKWEPAEGYVVETPFAKLVRHDGASAAITAYREKSADQHWFFMGELIEMGNQLRKENRLKEAAALLELAVELYPDIPFIYSSLGDVYRDLGLTAPPPEKNIWKMIDEGDTEGLESALTGIRKFYPNWLLWTEADLNRAGYQMLQKRDYGKAIELFELNVKSYPNAFNVYDSLGEALMLVGRKADAIENYKKSLELNPDNTNAAQMLQKMEKER